MTSKSTEPPARTTPAAAHNLSRLLAQLDHINGASPDTLSWDDGTWKVDFWRQCVSGPGGVVRLNSAELIIFGRLLAASGAVVERDALHADLLRLWDSGAAENVGSRLSLSISRMRNKFAQAGVPFPVRSVRGAGYQLTPPGNA
ncbi:helix-turn-helix domain-containing protein [Achromobacter spanius]|uniref:helix-turn-helix domain-containing protein n=1 Tax=Achromobacter spanius TaxID=217203 RepID=UPI0013DEE702|nr:helix-turn-helix domain-containing protein [Achromobacter spanius]